MPVFVCGESALEYYRNSRAVSEDIIDAGDPQRLQGAICRADYLSDTSLAGLCLDDPTPEKPLHVMVPDATMRTGALAVAPHVCTRPLPAGSLRRVNPEVFVTSPELTFVQLARTLDVPELVAVAMELCGDYRSDAMPYGVGERTTLYEEPQLTTVERLRAFIDAAGPLGGVKRAREALNHTLDFSASPMETVVYLLLCLPRRYGGYAFPVPELNPVLFFSKRGQGHTLRRSARGDLFWREARLDLEYNGGTHEASRAEDAMRRKALERMGVEVIELTFDEVRNAKLFHATALRVARSLGVRARVEGDFVQRRQALREMLLVGAWCREDGSLETKHAYRDEAFDYGEAWPSAPESWGDGEWTREDAGLPPEWESWDDAPTEYAEPTEYSEPTEYAEPAADEQAGYSEPTEYAEPTADEQAGYSEPDLLDGLGSSIRLTEP